MITKIFDQYFISDEGIVYDSNHNIISPWIDRYGYYHVSLTINGKRTHKKIHRLVATAFLNNCDNLPCVNHIDGIKTNNNVSNLEWCTYYHNNKHARDNKLNDVSFSNSKRWNNPEFRSKTSKRISDGMILSGCNRGKRNPRFKYQIFLDDVEIDRINLSQKLHLSQSYCDASIAKLSKGIIVPAFRGLNICVKLTKGLSTIETIASGIADVNNGVE